MASEGGRGKKLPKNIAGRRRAEEGDGRLEWVLSAAKKGFCNALEIVGQPERER